MKKQKKLKKPSSLSTAEKKILAKILVKARAAKAAKRAAQQAAA